MSVRTEQLGFRWINRFKFHIAVLLQSVKKIQVWLKLEKKGTLNEDLRIIITTMVTILTMIAAHINQ